LWFLPRELLLYASVLDKQLADIEPRSYVARPQFENLLQEHPNGFILLGMAGSGKSVIMQRTARLQAQLFKQKPRREHVPVFLVAGYWATGALHDHMYTVLSSYYPVKKSTYESLLRRNRLCLFLDGMDELLQSDRELRERELNEFYKRYPKTVIVVSSRLEIVVDALPKVTL
jgi:predicted NACHT family NTPase